MYISKILHAGGHGVSSAGDSLMFLPYAVVV